MIEKGKQVQIEYSVFLEDGTPIDTNVGQEPLSYQHGTQQLLPALEEELNGLDVGDQKQIVLEPDRAYGPILEEAFKEVDATAIPENLRFEGAVLGVQDDTGQEYRIRIHELKGDKVVVDFNHPLAGQTLKFDIKVVGVQ